MTLRQRQWSGKKWRKGPQLSRAETQCTGISGNMTKGCHQEPRQLERELRNYFTYIASESYE